MAFRTKTEVQFLMENNIYFPEGMRSSTVENIEALSTISGIERAMAQGKILEATAIVCDNNLNLIVDLVCMKGIIHKREVMMANDGEIIKDIAIISRVGKPVCFKVISIEKDSCGNPIAILSRRAAQVECMHNYLMKLTTGDIIPARVTHLEPFGAFVDIGCGIVSLMSIDCISVSRISHPRDRFTPGMYIRAVVKSIDYCTGRIYVTHKELLGTWLENAKKFEIGQTVTGIVRSIEDYGIFVELAPNLAGLAEYKEGIVAGQSAAVYIKNIIPERMKIKLVIIDTYKSEPKVGKIEYFIPEDCVHIDYWQYSPSDCKKVVETVFC